MEEGNKTKKKEKGRSKPSVGTQHHMEWAVWDMGRGNEGSKGGIGVGAATSQACIFVRIPQYIRNYLKHLL